LQVLEETSNLIYSDAMATEIFVINYGMHHGLS